MTSDRRASARAWLIWSVAVLAYAVAVFQRASLGVAGVQAEDRFGLTAGTLSLLGVVQLATYALLQVPTGVLLDRLGSRRMVITGALVMAAGQLLLALADLTWLAVAARLLVGAGDALTFISVLRLVPVWFSARQVPVVTQMTGLIGQAGQIAAAVPLVALLGSAGWRSSFLGAAAIGVVMAALVAAVVRDRPVSLPTPVVLPLRQVREHLGRAWAEPGTRIGLWAHFVSQFSGNAFALLWGFPFLVLGEGRSPAFAGAVITVLVVGGLVIGPVLGRLAGRFPLRRSTAILGIVLSSAAAWGLVLLWPGPAPAWLLVLLVLVLSTNGPGSLVGFDYARTYNPGGRLGSATGIVNVGGFVATLLLVGAIGLVLDLVTPTGQPYSLGGFRLALATQYVLWAVGLVGLWRYRRTLRHRLRVDDGIIIRPLPAALLQRVRAYR